MINQPLATVVTVTYNSSKFIRDAIESILHSSYTNFELIIGDDASTDETWSIIQEYKDQRIVAYRNESNLREYANRNKAIGLAKGEYLIFIDGDDMIYPHGLEFMVRMLHAFPSCAMALMRWFRNDLFYPVVITPDQFYIGEYFGHGFLGTAFSNILFRTRILLEEGGLPTNCKSGDDYIRYKIAARHNSLIINDGLTWWRETPGQASQLFMSSVDGIIETYQNKFAFLKNELCPLSKTDKILASKNLNILLAKLMFRKLLKLQLGDIIKIKTDLALSIWNFLNILKQPINKNPFEGYSPIHPYRHSFQNNPYSYSNKNA